MKKILTALVIAITAASVSVFGPATTAQAAASKPSYCKFWVNNGDLNPTWTARCYNTSKAYRAVAWCQIAWAYGDWSYYGGASTARCFLVLVDTKKSGVQFK